MDTVTERGRVVLDLAGKAAKLSDRDIVNLNRWLSTPDGLDQMAEALTLLAKLDPPRRQSAIAVLRRATSVRLMPAS